MVEGVSALVCETDVDVSCDRIFVILFVVTVLGCHEAFSEFIGEVDLLAKALPYHIVPRSVHYVFLGALDAIKVVQTHFSHLLQAFELHALFTRDLLVVFGHLVSLEDAVDAALGLERIFFSVLVHAVGLAFLFAVGANAPVVLFGGILGVLGELEAVLQVDGASALAREVPDPQQRLCGGGLFLQ